MKRVLIASVLMMLGLGTVAYAQSDSVTPDGLVKTTNSVFKNAWVDPDVDFSKYTKIMLGPAAFDYREVKKTPTRTSIRRGNQTEFFVDDKDRAKFEDTVSAIFSEQLGTSEHFEIASEPGPDVLVLQGMLFDIVSRVPPQLVGAGEIYVASVGEATLILEARDSMTGEAVYRAADRRNIQRPGRELMYSNSVTNWAEVRRWAKRWAVRLTDGLDAIHS